jgi:hypothetical protein
VPPARCSQGSSIAGVLEVFEGYGVVDGMQQTTANSRAWTARLISSNRGRKERLEELGALVTFG